MAADRKAMSRPTGIVRFDSFELDCSNRQLRHHGEPVELGSRYFDALALLVTRRGELINKDTFLDVVWHGIPVTDEALTQCIRTLRRALGDNVLAPRFIETVPKHGYRFIAEIGPETEVDLRTLASWIAGACTISGSAAGTVAGLFYGAVAGTGGVGQFLILAAMVGVLGLLAGAALGAGMAAALLWRGGCDGWIVAGTAICGLAVGALGNMLGREGVGLLSGVSDLAVTGPFEGVILGTATGLAAWAALAGLTWLTVIASAVLVACVAAAMIFLSGGTLLAGSLLALDKGVSGLQLDVAKIGILYGHRGMTEAAQGLSTAVECQMFVLAVVCGLVAIRDKPIR